MELEVGENVQINHNTFTEAGNDVKKEAKANALY